MRFNVEKICQNFSTLDGKDAILRLIVSSAILLEGLFSLADDVLLSEVPYHIQVFRFIFSPETVLYVRRASKVIAKSFSTSRLCLRFTEDIPAMYKLYKYLFNQSKSTMNGPKYDHQPKVFIFNYLHIILLFLLKIQGFNISNKK